MIRSVLSIAIIILLASLSFSQSDTEETRKRMGESGSTSDSTSQQDNDEEPGFGEQLLVEALSPFMEFMVTAVSYVAFNYRFTGGDSMPGQIQTVRYRHYPYEFQTSSSFRTNEAGSPWLIQPAFVFARDLEGSFFSGQFGLTTHFYGWAARLNYKHFDEFSSPYTMNYGSLRIERKSVTGAGWDMGGSLGIDLLKFESDLYFGFSLGYNLDIFFRRPFSFSLTPHLTFYENQEGWGMDSFLNYHMSQYYLGLGYELFRIAGVNFDNLQLRFGLYF